VKVA
jgi:hypothetical protein